MTVSAHNGRRPCGGATRKPADTTRHPFSLYRELHPEMFREQPARTQSPHQKKGDPDAPVARRLSALLDAGVTGTAAELAKRIGYADATVLKTLKIIGAKVIITRKAGSNIARIWGKA